MEKVARGAHHRLKITMRARGAPIEEAEAPHRAGPAQGKMVADINPFLINIRESVQMAPIWKSASYSPFVLTNLPRFPSLTFLSPASTEASKASTI